MKKILFFILCLPLWFTACNIHEWPVVEEVVPVQLSVEYNIQHLTWTGWDYMEGDEGSSSVGDTYANEIKEGKLRYTIRTFRYQERHGVVMGFIKNMCLLKM